MPNHIGQNHEPFRKLMKKKTPENRIHPKQNPAYSQQDRTQTAILYSVVNGDLIAIISWHNEQSSF